MLNVSCYDRNSQRVERRMRMETFNALWAELNEEGIVQVEVKQMEKVDLQEGEVLIKVHYSSVNFKDGLAATNSKSGVIPKYPMVLGIDLSGEVVESQASRFEVGDKVIVTNYGLGVSQYGGYSEYARVPADWVVPLPEGLSLRESMIIGTAGFTAGESIVTLEEQGMDATKGSVLVRGASGGVGGMAIKMLNNLHYTTIAESRKKDSQSGYLASLGADDIVHPDEGQLSKRRPLAKQQWQAVIDPVGGEYLGDYLAQLKYGGSVALSGNAGGIKFETTVLPFILRGIHLLGIDSVQYPMKKRVLLWNRLGSDLKPAGLERMIDHEVSLEELPESFQQIMDGKMTGRVLVKVISE